MKGFFDALEILGKESDVDIDTLVEKVKGALSKAMKKAYPYCENYNIEIDMKLRKFEISIVKLIVEDEPIDEGEINIEDAKKINPDLNVGDTVEVAIDTSGFGRAAAQSAKQSIKGDLRDINRENLLSQFRDKESKCISAVVTQVEPGRGTVTVMHDKTELYLFNNEQIPGEVLTEGQNIKVFVSGIVNKQKKPIIKISRVHKDMLRCLFESEIPEVADGTIEIMATAREAGIRSKVAVISYDANVEAVGSCIGPKRSRISVITQELSGERIDVIPYSHEIREFIARALAPATVIRVDLSYEEPNVCSVIVPDHQLSLAIGNKGQNAKLAARLTGYKIDIRAQSLDTGEPPVPDVLPDFMREKTESEEAADVTATADEAETTEVTETAETEKE